ncbi:MAG: peptidoglycan-binding protein [Bacillota bacterium]
MQKRRRRAVGIRRFTQGITTLFNTLTLKGKIVAGCALSLALILGVSALIAPPKQTSALANANPGTSPLLGTSPSGTSDDLIEIRLNTPTIAPTSAPTPTPDPTLKKGMDDERVKELQDRLMDLGYLDLDESTMHFGSATADAVKRFQRQHNLQMDGIAGGETLRMINSDEAKPYTLLQGTSGTDVDSFQRRLIELGYLSSSKATGYYGDETIAAVKDFQKRNKLTADGKAGEQTFNLIYSPDAVPSASKAQEVRRRANVQKMLEVAKSKIGCAYILGNEGPKTFDCSGFVYYCLKQAGSNRGRYNAAGYAKVSDWEKITSMSKLEKGDLLFFYNKSHSKIGHVGIYIGSGMMIDASSSEGEIVKRSCTTSWAKGAFVYARRPW